QAFTLHVIDVQNARVTTFHKSFEELLPILQWLAAEVNITKPQQVEHVINQCSLLGAAIHQPFEPWESVLVECANLTVKDGLSLQRRQSVADKREAFREIVVTAGVQPKTTVRVSLCDSPKTIPFQLE